MPTHAETREFDYSARQLYDLVADVEKYPEFLPWCTACRINERGEGLFYADLVIGYKMFREKFGSKVTLEDGKVIQVEYLSGPMKYLSNHWCFKDKEDGTGCVVDFYVDFEFKNPILQSVISTFFHEAVKRMVGAFETRAIHVYGAPK